MQFEGKKEGDLPTALPLSKSIDVSENNPNKNFRCWQGFSFQNAGTHLIKVLKKGVIFL